MMEELTLSIIKPDGVKKSIIGNIYNRFERSGLKIIAIKTVKLSLERAIQFYYIHKEKNFFNDLINFMISGPIVVQILQGNNAIKKNRVLMGNTNPKNALPGTIRYDFAENINFNIVHGSDSIDTAYQEISFFFKSYEIFVK
ncbi:nucleoside-diphosphate kinase [Candidatus Legionella polyplacis]|uniref:Nucleoside diphosphate kinase n=2 Tax=Candidatus Legionella polyplacis TaxID=2005262 RepID=A0ABZ2GXX9_9GAMM